MGFIFSACSIILGGILGSILGKKVNIKSFYSLSIAIMLISCVGLLENILGISDGKIVGEHTVVVTVALVVGCSIGDVLKIEDRLYALSKTDSIEKNGFIDSLLFFGIGGLQITGPILYIIEGDSTQLILKGIIDFPFALMLGAAYGRKVSLSALPVGILQVVTAVLAFYLGDFIRGNLICQLCSIGYMILFFSGFNMLCPKSSKIKNMNMLPGMFLIVLYNILTEVLL